jgi:HD-GYP domain-containing protein (c-di-GMP phosphodiesterase class II)
MIFITDRNDSKSDIQRKFAFAVNFDVLPFDEDYSGAIVPTVIIADLNMDSEVKIKQIKEKLKSLRAKDTDVFFILRKDTNREIHQAISLGAKGYFPSIASPEKIRSVTECPRPRKRETDVPVPDLAGGIDTIGYTLQLVDEAVKAAASIEQKAISDAAKMLRQLHDNNTIESLLQHILQFHNPTFRHSLLVSGFSAALAARAGCCDEECQIITEAALVHDIGKSLIPLWILDKPGALTAEEREIVNGHPVFGYDYLKRRGALSGAILAIVRSHHELLDGSGYPDRLSGDQISRRLRIVTICDIYAALIEPRSYKKPHPPMLAFAMLRGMIGKLDQDLLATFREIVAEYDGSLH